MRARIFAVVVAAALSVGATATSTATAGTLVKSAAPCAKEVLSQPFLPWADVAQYTLVPGGAAEAKSGFMKLARNATIASGNEPWHVHSASDKRHLALPAGSSATTKAVCVGIDHPTIRFFARSAATAGNWLLVEVLFEDRSGHVMSAPIGGIPGTGDWAPTAPIAIVANLLPLMPNNTTAVAFRLSPTTAAGWDVDDIYVDPFGRT